MNENTENSPLNDDPLPGTLPGWLPYLLSVDELIDGADFDDD